MVINLRSTNGGGKTHVIRALMALATVPPARNYGLLGPRKPEAYELLLPGVKDPTYLIGPYLAWSGGCDNIRSYDVVVELIKKYALRGHVIFEGVLISSTYGQIGTLMERWGKDSVFVFLDTPLAVCIQRVEERRGGKPRDARLIKNVSGKFYSCQQVKEKVERDGRMRTVWVNSTDGHKTILKLLQEG